MLRLIIVRSWQFRVSESFPEIGSKALGSQDIKPRLWIQGQVSSFKAFAVTLQYLREVGELPGTCLVLCVSAGLRRGGKGQGPGRRSYSSLQVGKCSLAHRIV